MTPEELKKIEKEMETESKSVKKFTMTKSLDPIKLKLFADDMTGFKADLTDESFRVYTAEYKFSAELKGKPEFIVSNRVKGFMSFLDQHRKLLFVVFIIDKVDGMWRIRSGWISNCKEDISKVIPEKYDDFIWHEVDIKNTEEVENVATMFRKSKDDLDDMIKSHLH